MDREKYRGREATDMRGSKERLTYNIEEAGRRLGIGRNQAYEAAKRGDFPIIKIGKRLLVPKAAFDRLLKTGPAA
jgi:excisionase family DNA binding protein